jgi:hypothetical protein
MSTPCTRSTPMLFPHLLGHFIGSGATSVNQFLPPRIVAVPDRQAAVAQKIFVVEPQFFQTAPGHISEFEFGFFEVPEAWLPSVTP